MCTAAAAAAGSSEALLSGQKPPFRLFVRAVHSDGTRAHHIRFAVSEAFVVRLLYAVPLLPGFLWPSSLSF